LVAEVAEGPLLSCALRTTEMRHGRRSALHALLLSLLHRHWLGALLPR
jgi:hypothetical protein